MIFVLWLYRPDQEYNMNLVRIPGTSLVRDTATMALINTDDDSKNDYYEKLRMLKLQKNEINIVKSEIEIIKKDMADIKNLMLKLLDKG